MMKVTTRKSVSDEPNHYMSSDNDFMEVTEWSNGEGFDFYHYEDKEPLKEKRFSMPYVDWDILKKLVKNLQKHGKH